MWYTRHLNKTFYISGFLYNLETEQILLLQSEKTDDTSSIWSMLGGECVEGEEPEAAFHRIVHEFLKLKLPKDRIYPIYDYFHDTLSMPNYVFYAEVEKCKDFEPLNGSALAWIDFDHTIKLAFTPHTKQDVIVGQRVINAKKRNDDENDEVAMIGSVTLH